MKILLEKEKNYIEKCYKARVEKNAGGKRKDTYRNEGRKIVTMQKLMKKMNEKELKI